MNHEVHLRQLHHHHEALWLVTSDPTTKRLEKGRGILFKKCSEIMWNLIGNLGFYLFVEFVHFPKYFGFWGAFRHSVIWRFSLGLAGFWTSDSLAVYLQFAEDDDVWCWLQWRVWAIGTLCGWMLTCSKPDDPVRWEGRKLVQRRFWEDLFVQDLKFSVGRGIRAPKVTQFFHLVFLIWPILCCGCKASCKTRLQAFGTTISARMFPRFCWGMG